MCPGMPNASPGTPATCASRSRAQASSAGIDHPRAPGQKPNKHLPSLLIEDAKMAPRHKPQLRAVHERELARGNKNRATLAVARKLVAYLLAADKSDQLFEPKGAGAKPSVVGMPRS